MSTDDSDPTPRVPDVEDPRPSTPFADDIDTGTASDPPVGSLGDEETTVTVDGRPVSLPPGSTLLDGVEELCSYQREDSIGPRSEVPDLHGRDRRARPRAVV